MDGNVDPALGWNYFARVLARIAKAHGATLWQIGANTGVHPQKIGRLIESMSQPGRFTVLSRTDLSRIDRALTLATDEKRDLAGAILVMGLQAQMTRHLAKDKAVVALAAADSIFPLIVAALGDDSEYIDEFFREEASAARMQSSDLDQELAHALELLDSAMLALHLSQSATDVREGINNAMQARYDFMHAMVELDNALPTTRQLPEWQMWRDEAAQGLREVNVFLDRHGM